MKDKLLALFKQFIRFGAVGAIATLISYGTYVILNNLGLTYNLSYTLGYIISFVFNYFASTKFTFKTEGSLNKGIKFALSHGFNYLLQMILLNLFISFGIPDNFAPLFVYAISIPINFLLVRVALKDK